MGKYSGKKLEMLGKYRGNTNEILVKYCGITGGKRNTGNIFGKCEEILEGYWGHAREIHKSEMLGKCCGNTREMLVQCWEILRKYNGNTEELLGKR